MSDVPLEAAAIWGILISQMFLGMAGNYRSFRTLNNLAA